MYAIIYNLLEKKTLGANPFALVFAGVRKITDLYNVKF